LENRSLKANQISLLVIIRNGIYISLGKQKEIESALKTLDEHRGFEYPPLDIVI
jgi:hypothetical protein